MSTRTKPHFFRVPFYFKHQPIGYFWAVRVGQKLAFGNTAKDAWNNYLWCKTLIQIPGANHV